MPNPHDFETLKLRLHQLSDDQLKQEYLDGMFKISSLADVLADVDSEKLTLRIINLALKLDVIQGTFLTRSVKPEFQTKALSIVIKQHLPLPQKIRLLGQTRLPRLIPWLFKGLVHQDEQVNAWSAWALTQIGTAAEPELLKALKHSVPKVRLWATWALGQIASSRSMRGLLLALNHEDAQVRWRAAAALGKLGNRLAVTKLREILASDSDHYVRGRAATALGILGGASSIIGLKNALDDPEFYVYTNAVYGLETIGDSFAIKILLQSLNHHNADVRVRAVEVLGRMGDESIISKLVAKLKDPSPLVRAKIVEAIQDKNTSITIKGLKMASQDQDVYVRSWATTALDKLNTDEAPTFLRTEFTSQPFKNRNLPKLWITSRAQASEYILNQLEGANIQYLISIGSPGSELPEGFEQVPNRLRLEFDDIDIPYNDPEYVLPNLKHILQALHFMKLVNPKQGDLLIHCQAGISRSCAIAYTVCAYRLGRGKEQEALAYILAVQPEAIPNQWIVELADIALKRGGKLTEALRQSRRTIEFNI